jgi:hypothetical protein
VPNGYIFLLIIPLALSAFTHLWNPVGFPSPDYDEGVYMRRAMHILDGHGLQEMYDSFAAYEHPYFGPLFLAAVLGLIGYPHSLYSSPDAQSIEILHVIPRLLMGFLAVVDTFLIFKIAELRYNRKVGFIASLLFAVMPSTWLIRSIWLESIQLPFILSSILFAIYLNRQTKNIENNNNENWHWKKILLIVLSGMSLGLAIFTKLPAFTMIPLVGFLILKNGNNRRNVLLLWIIPVILIPAIWPAYSIYAGQFSSWLQGVYFQTHRESHPLYESMYNFFKIDPVLLILGTVGLLFGAIKKDLLILLWVIPFLIFLLFIGYVSYYHLIPLIPAFCIGAARIIDYLPSKITNRKIQRTLYSGIVVGVGIFGLVTTVMLITVNLNTFYFEAAAFLSQHLTKNTNDTGNRITVIANPFYLWIPQYVFHLRHDYVPYHGIESIKTNKSFLIVDNSFLHGIREDEKLQKISSLLYGNKSSTIKFGNLDENGVNIISNNISNSIQQKQVQNLIDIRHKWESFGNANVSQNQDILHILVNNNTNNTYSGASLLTKVNLSENPSLLSLQYISKSSAAKATFYAEVTQYNKNGKSLWDFLINTFYAEVTEGFKNGKTALHDLLETFHEEIKKNSNGRIIWNDLLDNTNGSLTREVFLFPRSGPLTETLSNKDNLIEFRIYIIPKGPGEQEITMTKIEII